MFGLDLILKGLHTAIIPMGSNAMADCLALNAIARAKPISQGRIFSRDNAQRKKQTPIKTDASFMALLPCNKKRGLRPKKITASREVVIVKFFLIVA